MCVFAQLCVKITHAVYDKWMKGIKISEFMVSQLHIQPLAHPDFLQPKKIYSQPATESKINRSKGCSQ